MENNNGLYVAVLGGIIAVFSIVVGVGGGLGEAQHEHYGAAQVLLPLGMLGGFAGLWVFLEGAVMALSNRSKERSSGRLKRCHHCGTRLVGSPKTCEFCGVDVKQP